MGMLMWLSIFNCYVVHETAIFQIDFAAIVEVGCKDCCAVAIGNYHASELGVDITVAVCNLHGSHFGVADSGICDRGVAAVVKAPYNQDCPHSTTATAHKSFNFDIGTRNIQKVLDMWRSDIDQLRLLEGDVVSLNLIKADISVAVEKLL